MGEQRKLWPQVAQVFLCEAVVGTGSGNFLLPVVVSLGFHKAVLIAVPADCAGVVGIAHMGTIRLNHSIGVGVRGFGDGLLIGFAAVSAGESHDSRFCAGSFLGHGGFVCVVMGLHVRIPVAVSAGGAGKCGISHGFTGGRRDLRDIAVTGSGDQVVHIAVFALRAGIRGISHGLTGRSGYRFCVAVSACRDDIGFLPAAGGTGSGLHPRLGAGGFLFRSPLRPGVIQSGVY